MNTTKDNRGPEHSLPAVVEREADRDIVTGYRDAAVLSRWTAGFLYAQIFMSILAIASGTLESEFLSELAAEAHHHANEPLVAAASTNAIGEIVALGQSATFVTSAVLILMWIHRAAFNIRRLGATGLAFSPAWCVGWHFIPGLG